MIRPLCRILVVLGFVHAFTLPAARGAETFVAGIDDLPLMPGLAALPTQGVVFDVPGGRIVEAWAQGAVTRGAVLTFYGSTLPQLGWSVSAPDLFRREGETLRLEFPPGAAAGTLLIRFYLSPG